MDNTQICECANCGWKGPSSEADLGIDVLLSLPERVDPGEPFPAGECPKCKSLCHVEQALPILAIVVEGGIVQAVVSDKPGLVKLRDLMVIDYDAEGADLDEISLVPQEGGTDAEAIVVSHSISLARINLAGILPLIPASEDNAS
ncbi:hypothetical protein [Taklimakanibacter albus]|uniref:Uncharacterized protein n=1 Tax=Taklimakanibacter albus TaxID=2800327 RepID=A0ACC5RFU0_9HYPH|nr:hypothetical protein [Aestuariivirga sp. YIM B02566]MBK1871589.1 hypothetical protein [Aestuariivirga sp. YIM B02566]